MEDKENQPNKSQSIGKRLRNLSGDLLKKTPKENSPRARHQSGEVRMTHERVKHPSGERYWDLTGDEIRDVPKERLRSPSGDSCNSCTSPLPLGKGSKVMIALDDSHHSEETIHYYLRHVHRQDNDVILAHVIELPDNASEAMRSMLSRETIDEMWQQGVAKAEQIEKQYAEILREAGIEHVHISNKSGLKPGHALCSLAEQEGVNMIIVGSRGEGKLRRTLLGSVSDYIVQHAHCPTLVCQYSKTKRKNKHQQLK